MREWKYSGARWWKFDFHTHTPASRDFTKDTDEVTPESWLKAFMEKKIDCVAVTDHNCGDWIDRLKQELGKLKENQPIWYQPLYLFPGVEISTYDDVHLLAIFGCNTSASDIDRLLGAVDYSGKKGESNDTTDKRITEVIDEITKFGGIPIPAHVDQEKGLFKLNGKKLKKMVKNKKVYAVEVRDNTYDMPPWYKDEKGQWTIVKGSDTHELNGDTFGTFTWVKMDEPSIEGLKLALRDGDASINRCMSATPNKLPTFFIENLEISDAQYIGRSAPLNCKFSPFLNTIIGGRGSGKSTLLELIRLVLRRDKDIPEALEEENRKYFSVGEVDSLLIEDSKISLIYNRNQVRYRLNWSAKAMHPSLEQDKDGTWQPCEGEIKSLFPVYIYSQKQIFELARNPRALIDIIDEAPEVDAEKLKTQAAELVNRYKQIEAKQRELNDKIAQKSRLRGELADTVRQIELIEKSGHKAVLQNYRQRQQQLNELDNLESKWREICNQLLQARDNFVPPVFNMEQFTEDTDILSSLEMTTQKWEDIQGELTKLGEKAQSVIAEWEIGKNEAAWMQVLKSDMAQYEQLRSELENRGIDPKRYPMLLAQQKSRHRELDLIDEHKARYQELETEKQDMFEQIRKSRETLSKKRQKFLSSVLQDNQLVNIKVQPFGEDWEGIENEIRRILQCQEGFDKDIKRLKGIYNENGDRNIEKLKEEVRGIYNGEKRAKDNRFTSRLKSLPQESLSDLYLWFPGDDLKVTFGPKNQLIEQGSPGQKTAALLAFILSYGDEPLLLDQPEDDLDNELIYDLIVQQLRKTKSRRQVIIVTHNANIVVNGDAEMVLPLEVAEGETRVQQAASIQKEKIRQAICDILEGGERAFERRYKRIHLRG